MTRSMPLLLLFACVFVIVSPVLSEDLLSLLFGGSNSNFEQERIASQIRIRIYTGPSIRRSTPTDIQLKETGLIYNAIDHSKPLVLYIHGYQEHPSNESVRTIVGAHLQRGNDNIMLLDWSDLAFQNYISTIVIVPDIAKTLARTFDGLVHLGLNLETFHCVGHSLGAQVCGFLGKYSSNSIPRITGLDPAKPGFYYPGAEHIDAESARFVDIIHTDGGLYGAIISTGTVDFFANGGTRPQPGCPLFGVPLSPIDLCSHWRSWRYYAESVLNEFAFLAVQCPSYSDYVLGKCARNRYIYYGYATPTNVRGSFYFGTNAGSPFSKDAGIYAAPELET